MQESIQNAVEEMKRVDHLIFVSLKYTRTVDVFKNTLSRIIDGMDFGITALIKSLEEKNKVENPPVQPIPRCNILRQHFSHDETIMEMVDFYLFLRKLNKAEFEKAREFRRHVTMSADIDGIPIEINIDVITEYYKKARNYIIYIQKILLEHQE